VKRPPIYYANFAHTPMPRRERLGLWSWVITDGMTGPILAYGTAQTERAALRARLHAEMRCRPESERPESEREQLRLDAICARLHEQGIEVEARYDEQHRVCVHPCCEVTTADEVRVLREFLAITSSVRWEVA
jgi:hypothetical protein